MCWANEAINQVQEHIVNLRHNIIGKYNGAYILEKDNKVIIVLLMTVLLSKHVGNSSKYLVYFFWGESELVYYFGAKRSSKYFRNSIQYLIYCFSIRHMVKYLQTEKTHVDTQGLRGIATDLTKTLEINIIGRQFSNLVSAQS